MNTGVANPGLVGIILAAGGSSRLGQPKQLLTLNGETLVQRAARLARPWCAAGLVVVTGSNAAAVESALAGMDVRCVRNAGWRSGMAGSLATGVAKTPPAAAILVMLCDQVALGRADIGRLVDAHHAASGSIVASAYAGRCGVPAIFPASYRVALMDLRGDQGARALIAAAQDVVAVAMPAATHDIDTPADLDALRKLPGDDYSQR